MSTGEHARCLPRVALIDSEDRSQLRRYSNKPGPSVFAPVVHARIFEAQHPGVPRGSERALGGPEVASCNLICYAELFNLVDRSEQQKQTQAADSRGETQAEVDDATATELSQLTGLPGMPSSAVEDDYATDIDMLCADSDPDPAQHVRYAPILSGSVFTTMLVAPSVFAFTDLAIPSPGTFVMRYRAMNIFSRAADGGSIPILAECLSAPFEGPTAAMNTSAVRVLAASPQEQKLKARL